ncbi:unnamed protein product [Debaryomyces fabryi]|nr:unnamed protein product [Debaryomyces fabryi]
MATGTCPARGDWYQNFLVMAQSEIEKFFRRRVIPTTRSKSHTGTVITRSLQANSTEIEVTGEIVYDTEGV